MGNDYCAKVIVGIDINELIIDNSKKTDDSTINVICSMNKSKNKSKYKSKYKKRRRHDYTKIIKPEYKVKGFNDDVFNCKYNVQEFIVDKLDKLDIECVYPKGDSIPYIIGKNLFIGNSVNNSAYEVKEHEQIAEIKANFEKTIFEIFGVKLYAKIHFVGYYY